MKQKLRQYTIAAFLLVFLASCAVTDFDKSADFSRYRTFAWGKGKVDVDDPVYKSELITKNIRNTVENEFAKRGIVRNDRNPDFVVTYQTYTEKKERTRVGYPYAAHPFGPFGFYPFGFGWAFPYWMPYGGYAAPITETVTEGTLIIDITDSKTKQLVWRGSVKGEIDHVSSLRKQIQKAIKAILKKYPVTPREPLPLIYNEDAIS